MPELGTRCKDSTSPMSESEYSESDSGERSGATGQGKTPLRKDEVIIVQEKLEQWMAADATKRKSMFKDIASSVQRLEANRTLKSHQWVIKKKVSAPSLMKSLPYFVFS